ncbi:MAG: hypothetical protein WAO00_19725, partial [Chthoniobacterales bacterium]
MMRSPRFHPNNESESVRFRRLVVVLLISLINLASSGPSSAAKAPPTGSHIPEVEHPFAIPDSLWRSLFAATTPGGRQLSASQIAPLVRRQFWPAGTYTSTNWHLK